MEHLRRYDFQLIEDVLMMKLGTKPDRELKQHEAIQARQIIDRLKPYQVPR